MGRQNDNSIYSPDGEKFPAFVVRAADGRVLVALSGADAADAALEYAQRGYDVDEIDAALLGANGAHDLSLTA